MTRASFLQIRCSEAEKLRLKADAAERGVRMTDLVRQRLGLDGRSESRGGTTADSQATREALGESESRPEPQSESPAAIVDADGNPLADPDEPGIDRKEWRKRRAAVMRADVIRAQRQKENR